jgi:hypothetical protein
VDIPAVDCVLFADPKQSVVDIVQAAGRAMRPHPGKRFGYVLVPIIVPSGMDFETFAETTEFKQVARVITALSTQDGRIAEELLAVTERRRSRGRIVDIKGEIPLGYQISLDEFRDKVRLKVWERVGAANWRPFEEARRLARGLNLTSSSGWRAFSRSDRRPCDIPAKPQDVYERQGWVSWGDWLGTGRVAWALVRFRPFIEARAYVRRLRLKSKNDWSTYCASGTRPPDVPSNPQSAYRASGWAGWGDWLGTGTVAPHERAYRPFPEARNFVRKQRLKSVAEWDQYRMSGALPSDIPKAPWQVYRNKGWRGWGDFLGTGTVAPFNRVYRPFPQARAFARRLALRSRSEWTSFARTQRLPHDIPVAPEASYHDKGWSGWGDWLGTGAVAPRLRVFREFADARAYVRRLGLTSQAQWREFCRDGKLRSCPVKWWSWGGAGG